MKAWKFLILVGGIAGIVGFFQPFARGRVERADLETSFTAYQLARGVKAKDIVPELEKVGRTRADAERDAKALEEGLPKVGPLAIAIYAPAVLLALFGAIAVVRGRIGRLGGLVALLLGVTSAGLWAILYMASRESHDATITLGLGANLLLVAGLAGVLAGLGALVAPDRGTA